MEIKKLKGGKADAREVGQLAAEAIARRSGQRKERYEQIKVQQVQPYQHGDCCNIFARIGCFPSTNSLNHQC
jgi:hypothetical protein